MIVRKLYDVPTHIEAIVRKLYDVPTYIEEIVRKLTTGRHKVRPLHPTVHIVAHTPRMASTRSPCASAKSVKSA